MARASSALLKRRLDIAEIVRKQREVRVDQLSELLNVSAVTIRQDLTYLEQQGYLKRSFGGAIYLAPDTTVASANFPVQGYVQYRDVSNDIDLVKQCLDHINDGDTLFLSHGDLIRKLIPFLHTKKSITLITNDLANAQLAKEFTFAEVIVIGGLMSDDNIVQDSKMISFILSQYPVTQFIVEVAGFNVKNELIIEDMGQVKSYRQLMKSADYTTAILPHRVIHNETNSIGKLRDTSISILSRSVVAEYHQQLLDCHFKQINSSKNSITYQNTLGT